MDSKEVPSTNRVVPHFANETDEADWWLDNKDLLEQEFLDALQKHEIGGGRPSLLKYTVAPATPAVITLDAEDEKRACELAARRGESYEAFVRPVVHQALELEKTA